MRIARRLFGVLALLAGFAAAPGFAATTGDGLVPIPPVARVTDLTNTLSPAQKNSLGQTLAEFEQRKGSQIAVLMLPSTKPEEIEQYGIRVAEQWKLGRKDIADGIILLVAKDDHRVRIEVGRGLEGPVPDVTANRVIREIIAPHFLNGDFYGGIEDGVQRLIGLVDGEKLPPPPPSASRSHRSSGGSDMNSLLSIGFVLIFVVGGLLVRMMGRVAGSGAVGIIAAIAAWVIIGGLLAAIGAGGIGFIAALLFGSGFGGPGLGGWGFGGGGGGFGGGGGGGFSGGGGDFGGGGASGSW
jgi:uncharacterized protein